jgi:hypothetical protein
MLIMFFGYKDVELVFKGQTVEGEVYLEILRSLRASIRQKNPNQGRQRDGCCTMTIHQGTHHCSFGSFSQKRELVIPQPPYSPNLAPGDFFLFPKLKSILKVRRFDTIEKVKENSLMDLKKIPKQVFEDCFEKWKKR